MSFSRSHALHARAARVIPNGLFGHRRSFAFVEGASVPIPDDYPRFVRGARGCRFEDVDGNAYIDLLCGYGPMSVGYAEPSVDAAFAAQQARGLCYDFPSEVEVLLAERLIARQGASWAAFSLNGTDAISLALTVARAATGRSVLLVAEGAYHGNLAATSFGAGRASEERSAVRAVPWGDLSALARRLRAEPVAAVLLCPWEQAVGAPNPLPAPGHWAEVRRQCDAAGALLILDDVRSGFRVDSCRRFGIAPDLVCRSKAIANGYPLAVTLGLEGSRAAAEEVFATGTFWGFPPAQAAALATLDLLDARQGEAHMAAMGSVLTAGLREAAGRHGFELDITGPEAMPMVLFSGDPAHALSCAFARELVLRGVFAHPTHNWFLSLAHEEGDIHAVIERADDALRALHARRGEP
ncbi:MAG: aminotransferase class III-fold pyridoxal phosphate-dependent enzyme [Pseudomonadota bacterium]